VNIYLNSEDKVTKIDEPTRPPPNDSILDFSKIKPADVIDSLLTGKSINDLAQKEPLEQSIDPIKPARDAAPFENRTQ